MKNNQTKAIVGAVSLITGIVLNIMSHIMNPADDTAFPAPLLASIILIFSGIIAIFSIKTETAKVTEDIDEKFRPLAKEAKTMKEIGNSLYLLSFLEAIVIVCLDLDSWLYMVLSSHMVLDIIIALLLRWSGKSRMEKIKMLMREEKAGNMNITIVNS